jgi:outer membrane protein
MKYGLLIWNVVLTAAAGYLFYANFSRKNDKPTVVKQVDESNQKALAPFRIAYFEMDSVEAHFDMVKDVKAEIGKKDEEYTNQLSRIDMTYNNEYNKLANSAKSQQEVEAAQNQLRVLSENLRTQKQEIDQKYQNFVMLQNLNVKKKIEEFLAEYNKDRNYSYIVSYEQGLFYYKDTAYNITADLIKGLNESYKKNKSKKN